MYAFLAYLQDLPLHERKPYMCAASDKLKDHIDRNKCSIILTQFFLGCYKAQLNNK